MLRYSSLDKGAEDLQTALDCMLTVLKYVNDSMHQVAITGYEVSLSVCLSVCVSVCVYVGVLNNTFWDGDTTGLITEFKFLVYMCVWRINVYECIIVSVPCICVSMYNVHVCMYVCMYMYVCTLYVHVCLRFNILLLIESTCCFILFRFKIRFSFLHHPFSLLWNHLSAMWHLSIPLYLIQLSFSPFFNPHSFLLLYATH